MEKKMFNQLQVGEKFYILGRLWSVRTFVKVSHENATLSGGETEFRFAGHQTVFVKDNRTAEVV